MVIEVFCLLDNVVPGNVAELEDVVVGEVFRHLPLVPSLTHHEEAVGGAIIQEENQGLVSLLNDAPEMWVPRRICQHKARTLQLLGPVPPAVLIDGFRPLLQGVEPVGFASGTPQAVLIKSFAQAEEDFVHVNVEPELPAALNQG